VIKTADIGAEVKNCFWKKPKTMEALYTVVAMGPWALQNLVFDGSLWWVLRLIGPGVT